MGIRDTYVKPLDPNRKRHRARRKRKPKILEYPLVRRTRQKCWLNPEQLIERQERIWKLRVDGGKTFAQIEEIEGVSDKVIRADLQVIRRAKFDGLVEKDDNVLTENNVRYDQIIARWLPLAMSEELDVSDVTNAGKVISLPSWEASKQATEVLLKTLRQREQLNGFHDPKAPQKVSLDFSPEAMNVLDALRRAALQPKVIQAEVIEDGQSH